LLPVYYGRRVMRKAYLLQYKRKKFDLLIKVL
jgi:hypothetical protein